MYTIKFNETTFLKVTEFKTSESILGQRLIIKQVNGVKHSILIRRMDKLEIEREGKWE